MTVAADRNQPFGVSNIRCNRAASSGSSRASQPISN
jgi:hypothetical protein